jgi:hypothetical protein
MKNIYKILPMVLLLLSVQTFAQKRKERLEKAMYGNLLNPSFSSVLLPKGFVEVNWINSLLTANRLFDTAATKNDLNARETYFSSTLRLTYGITGSGRFNAGLDITYANRRLDKNPENSPLLVFNFSPKTVIRQQSDIVSISPRVRFMPLKHNDHFVVQSSVSLPLARQERQTFLGANRIFWDNQFLYNFEVGDNLFVVAQLGVGYAFRKDTLNRGQLNLPLSVFGAYKVNDRIIPFLFASHTRFFTKNFEDKFGTLAHTTQLGAGLQYQFSLRFSLNAAYLASPLGKNYRAYNGFTLSTRIII